MGTTLRDVIRGLSASHLKSGYQLWGQCLTATGFVANTVPDMTEEEGLIEAPMDDVAGGGFVVGSALIGKRPIYVIRYQGFGWYNLISVLNYACKSKEMWGISCPIFVRSIAMEGGIGPVAGSSHHSLAYRMPGVKIYSPMTPQEYRNCYNDFMAGDDVFYVSEHRGSYNNIDELDDIIYNKPDFALFPISITRFAAIQASQDLLKEGIKVSVFHQRIIKPTLFSNESIQTLQDCPGLVLDDDYPDGVASCFAQKLMLKTTKSVWSMGLEDRTAGFAPRLDNLPPTADRISSFIRMRLDGQN